MAGEDDVVVNLPDDLSGPLVDMVLNDREGGDPTKVVARKVNEEQDDPVLDLKAQMATLQSQNTTLSTQANANAERAARAERERDEARHNVTDSQFDTIVSGINAARAEADAAELALTDAHERGDARAIAKANRMMAEATSKLMPLEMAKSELEAERKTRPVRTDKADDPPLRVAPSDPVESYLASRTPKSAQWLRNGRTDYITDQAKNNKLIGAHYSAVGEGITPDTPEYFAHLEQQLGLKQVQKRDQQQSQRRPSAPSAPVSTPSGGLNGGRNEVTLTAGEARSATDGTLVWNYDDDSGQKRFKKGEPIGLAEMARRKMKMTAEGQYDKTLTHS